MRNDEGNALGWPVPAFQAEERAAGYAQSLRVRLRKSVHAGPLPSSLNHRAQPGPRL
jgi:hypothetical protein